MDILTKAIASQDYLMHYGILGQKWGVRRYQNKDGSLTEEGRKHYNVGEEVLNKNGFVKGKDYYIVNKGQVYSHVSKNKKIKLNDDLTYLYDDQNARDKSVYEGPFSRYLSMYNGAYPVYKHKYKTLDDLYVAPIKTQKEEFKKLLLNDDQALSEVSSMTNNLIKNGWFTGNSKPIKKVIGDKRFGEIFNESTTTFNDVCKKATPKEQTEIAYLAFNVYAERVNDYYSTKKFIDNIKSYGFNAVEDANNKGIYNSSENPIVVLDGKLYLKENRLTSKITWNDIRKNEAILKDALGTDTLQLGDDF